MFMIITVQVPFFGAGSLAFQPSGSLCTVRFLNLALRQRPASPGLLSGTLIRLPGPGENGAAPYVCGMGVLSHASAALSDARQGGVQPPCGRTPLSQTFRNSPFSRWPGRKGAPNGRALSECQAHRMRGAQAHPVRLKGQSFPHEQRHCPPHMHRVHGLGLSRPGRCGKLKHVRNPSFGRLSRWLLHMVCGEVAVGMGAGEVL